MKKNKKTVGKKNKKKVVEAIQVSKEKESDKESTILSVLREIENRGFLVGIILLVILLSLIMTKSGLFTGAVVAENPSTSPLINAGIFICIAGLALISFLKLKKK